MFDRVSESSVESFIVRVYRQFNQKGFVKAFSDDAESLQYGFSKVERILKLLYMKKLYIWPRFQALVMNVLSENQPNVIELTQPLSNNMKSVQSAILVALNICMNELKKSISHISSLDLSDMTLENGLIHSFDLKIRSLLDPMWHRLSIRSKQFVTDLTTLRKLLDYLLRYDAFSFYVFLLSLRQVSEQPATQSLW